MKKANRKTPPPPRARATAATCFCAGAGPRLTALTSGMFERRARSPVFDHFRTAGVEVLKGFRAILDAQIDAMSRQSRKGTKVPVE